MFFDMLTSCIFFGVGINGHNLERFFEQHCHTDERMRNSCHTSICFFVIPFTSFDVQHACVRTTSFFCFRPCLSRSLPLLSCSAALGLDQARHTHAAAVFGVFR